MTSLGSAHGRFTRAIQTRNLWAAEVSLRELGGVLLEDALGYLDLPAEQKPDKLERAAVRWHGRLETEAPLLTLAESQLALAALSSPLAGERDGVQGHRSRPLRLARASCKSRARSTRRPCPVSGAAEVGASERREHQLPDSHHHPAGVRNCGIVEPPPASDLTAAIYESISARQINQDAMLWQTPALGLTAQAFLFTIALSGGNSQAARLMAASLALLVSLLTMQLMARHRQLAGIDANVLEEFEAGQALTQARGAAPHQRLVPTSRWWILRLRSTTLWIYGLGLFGLAAATVIVLTAVSPGTLAH